MILVERKLSADAGNPSRVRESDPRSTHLDFPSARQPGWQVSVRCRTDAHCAFVRLREGWLYVATPVGLECFPDLTRILNDAAVKNLHSALEALEQQRLVAFVAYDQGTEELNFGRSLDGFASLYFGGEASSLVIADSSVAVARRLGPVRLSKADEAAYLKNWSPCPEGSFLESVKRGFAGVGYRTRVGYGAIERRLMAPSAEPLDQAAGVALLREELLGICATYGTKRVALRLSGGVDSRTILAALMDAVREGILHRDQILLTSVLFPGFDCDESAEIGEIAQRSGFEWAGVEATPERVAEAFEQTLLYAAPPFPTAFMGVLCMSAAQARGVEIMLSGHGGDEILDFDQADVLGRPWFMRMRHIGLMQALRKAQRLSDRIRTLAVTFLGRRGMRGLRRELRANGGSDWLHAHRLGRRLGAAPGCGYEALAVAATRQNLCTDAPLFRADLISRLDPVGYRHAEGNFKAVARAYMCAVAPDVARVPTRKAVFDAMVRARLPARIQIGDQIDTNAASAYGSGDVYRAWRAQFGHTGGQA